MQLQDLEKLAQESGHFPLRPAQGKALAAWAAGGSVLLSRGTADDALLIEAEAMAADAMRLD